MVRLLGLFVLLCFQFHATGQVKKVLFLGNSYTGVNNLPLMIQKLASSAGDSLFFEKNTPGGYTLGYPPNGHLYNQTSLELIAQGSWDYVVLQEQSQFPTIPYYRDNYFFSGGIALDSLIKSANPCTETMMYMTWGRKYGGQQCIETYCSPDFVDFHHMQDSLESAYMNLANHLNATVSPVGISWENSILSGDPIELFMADNSHPSVAGSYLAACTFYATIFHKSPAGLSYHASLEATDANFLQDIAYTTVLTNPSQWNIKQNQIKAGFDFIIQYDSVFFYDTSQHADYYFWDFGDGTTDTTQNPVHHYSQNGFYLVKQVVRNECDTDSTTKWISINITGINLIPETNEALVYPVPATDILYIHLNTKSKMPENFDLMIFDITGALIYKATVPVRNDDCISININILPTGTYTMKLSGDQLPCLYNRIIKR